MYYQTSFMTDEQYIKRTLRLAVRAQGMTSPNPMVGAVLIKNGKILSEDFHRKAGAPHAEALVIAKAGEKTIGSTLYINLEPCCHTEKRTPPCTKAIIRAGIKKVIIAMKDPNPQVSGMGIAELQRAGIEVRTGVLEDKAQRLNEAYIKYITTGKPFVTLKIAMTLDGKIATPEGESKWITGEKARKQVHRLRSSVDAVLTAIGTVKADNPHLTARFRGSKNPVRIVIDPNLEIPLQANILKVPPETIIVTRSIGDKADHLEKAGIKIIRFKENLDLHWLMERLGNLQITSVLIEGGSSLNAHALEDGIVDKVILFIAPKIIGGKDSYPAVGGKTFRRLEEAYRLKNISIRKIGDDFFIEGYVQYEKERIVSLSFSSSSLQLSDP
jgi:diaminohydroxyphosphoribosylaminopyrimidine deaminase / 5-amino-6-(5-phosphoribosylamino)uracil reductase